MPAIDFMPRPRERAYAHIPPGHISVKILQVLTRYCMHTYLASLIKAIVFRVFGPICVQKMSCKWSLVKLSSSSSEKIRFVILAVRITASGTRGQGKPRGRWTPANFFCCLRCSKHTHTRAHTLTKFRQNSHTKTCRRCRTGTKCNENVKKEVKNQKTTAITTRIARAQRLQSMHSERLRLRQRSDSADRHSWIKTNSQRRLRRQRRQRKQQQRPQQQKWKHLLV